MVLVTHLFVIGFYYQNELTSYAQVNQWPFIEFFFL